MRKSLFFIIFFCSYSNLLSQSFVKFFENDESNLGIYDVIYDEECESYFTLGNKIDSLHGLWIAKLDKHGDLIKERFIYGDTLYNFQLKDKNKLVQVDSGLYFTSGILAFSQSQQYELFFDSELEIMSYVETSPIASGKNKFNFGCYSLGNGIILTGTKQKDNFEIDTYVNRKNITGIDIWEVEIGTDDGYNNRYSSTYIFDSLVIIGTSTGDINNNPQLKSNCHITFIDAKDGSIVHELDLQVPESSNIGPTEVIPFERDGELLLAFSSRESTYNEEWFEYRNQIRYFITDMEGNVVDSVRLGNDLILSNGLFYNSRRDDQFISSGVMVLDDESGVLPVIGTFDKMADTIWWSIYDINDMPSAFDRYDVTGQQILPDGSIVICGNLEHRIPDTNTKIKRPYLLKLDSDGCLEPGCRMTSSTFSHFTLLDNGRVYPNPFSESFTFDAPFEGRLYVFDLLGNLIISKQLDAGKHIVDLSNIQSGVYLYYYTGFEDGIISGKLFKQ